VEMQAMMIMDMLNSINDSNLKFYIFSGSIFRTNMILLEAYTVLKSADTLNKYFDFITWFQELGFFHCVSDAYCESDKSERARPSGVPVIMILPASRVVPCDIKDINVRTSKSMSFVLVSCRSCPFTRV
jgi:hypothetical protein